jgi:hypothetical protein
MHKVQIENFNLMLLYIEFTSLVLTFYGGIGLFN